MQCTNLSTGDKKKKNLKKLGACPQTFYMFINMQPHQSYSQRVHKDKVKGERGNNKETQNIFQKEKENRKSVNIEEQGKLQPKC